MKNKGNKNESIFQKKGFYVALYSCLGVALVSASVISIVNITEKQSKESAIVLSEKQEVQTVDSSTVDSYLKNLEEMQSSYLTPEDRQLETDYALDYDEAKKKEETEQEQEDVDSKEQLKQDLKNEESDGPTPNNNSSSSESSTQEVAKVTETPSETPSDVENKSQDTSSNNEAKKQEEPAPSEVPTETPSQSQDTSLNDEAKKEEAPTEVPTEAPTQTPTNDTSSINEESIEASTNASAETNANATFAPFADTDAMSWPVSGEIVMDFSMNKLVYDKTLDQYRTNSNICISAVAGTQVKASSDGRVVDVGVDSQHGNSVTIDHGNGWSTTYSQLQANILVKEGDVVTKGQIIGGVSEPTYYGVLLGDHLSFTVARNDELVDPKSVLQ